MVVVSVSTYRIKVVSVSTVVDMVGLSGLTPEHKGVQQVISLSAEKVVARSEGREVSSVLLEHKSVAPHLREWIG